MGTNRGTWGRTRALNPEAITPPLASNHDVYFQQGFAELAFDFSADLCQLWLFVVSILAAKHLGVRVQDQLPAVCMSLPLRNELVIAPPLAA